MILLETRVYMEKQIDEYQVRISQLLKNENESYKFKQELNELLKERDIDKLRIRELIEKTTKQELEIKNLLNEHHNLNEEMQYYKNKSSTGSILTNQTTTTLSTTIYNQSQHPINELLLHNDANTSTDLFTSSFEMQSTNSLKAKILQLELDKKKCEYEINGMRENELKSINEMYSRDIEIENLKKEIRELKTKVENSKLEQNETEKIKELSLQLIKLQFDEKQLRKIKVGEENETLVLLKQNEEKLKSELEQMRLENVELMSIGKRHEEELLKRREDFENIFNQSVVKESKALEREKELQHENESLKSELVNIVKEKELCEDQVKTFETELVRTKQQLEAKTTSLNEFTIKVKLLTEQYKEEQLFRKKCSDFENEIDTLKQNYRNLEIETNSKQERIKELENEIEMIKQQQKNDSFKVCCSLFYIFVEIRFS